MMKNDKVRINNPYKGLSKNNSNYRDEIVKIANELSRKIDISYDGDVITEVTRVYNRLFKGLKY